MEEVPRVTMNPRGIIRIIESRHFNIDIGHVLLDYYTLLWLLFMLG